MRHFHPLLSLLILSLVSCLPIAQASAEPGDWRVYAAYHDATQTAVMDGVVYVLSADGLYSYGIEDTEVRTYDKATILSDNGIYAIRACAATDELVIVYENGNIDLFSPSSEEVFNLSDLKTKSLSDKTIHDVLVTDEGMLYICTSSGIVCANLRSRTFGDFYSLGTSVSSVALLNGYIYAATDSGVLRGNTADNLLDPTAWTQLKTYVLSRLLRCGETLYALATDAVYQVSDLDKFNIKRLSTGRYSNWNVTGEALWVYPRDAGSVLKIVDTEVETLAWESVYFLSYADGTYWAACGTSGLCGLKSDGSVILESVIPDSPARNYTYRFCRPSSGRLLITGGAFNYPEVSYEGTLMRYEDGTWSAFDETLPIELVGSNYYRNLTDIVQDPSDETHHWVSAACSGLYEFRDFKLVNHYGSSNSPLVSILPNNDRREYYVRVTGLNYDDDHNLWMLNCQVDTVVRILRNDGTWTAYYYPEIAGYPTFDHVMFDQRGWAWINSRRSTSSGSRAGVLVVNTNGTIATQRDDTYRFLSTFSNQDGTSYTPTLFNCMTEDHDGAIWLGTDRGVFVSYNPSDVFNEDFYLTQIKVPRNDGTDLADYLLSDVTVTCITVDGGNRKWIGTSGSGVFLVSADGLETIQHFTTADSPLTSNEIYDINVDGLTGEVFFATGAGLCSYMADATDAASSWDEDVVKVYPNPVRPEYSGLITVTGLQADSDVKIVNAAGRLVNRGTSVGGSYTWNGCLSNGKRCASGVYFVLAADAEGNDGVAAKFLVVSE